jgi:hypothetical protein
MLVLLGAIALVGMAIAWNGGQLPQREPTAASTVATKGLAPDLALYRDVIAEVRSGRDYYNIAAQKIPHYGFPISSPLNWRLPTYAWLLSRLPPALIQPTLVLLSIIALMLAFAAQLRTDGIGYAALTTFLLFGVVRWSIDGHAYLAQEPWAATLIIISLSAYALGGRESGIGGRGSGVRSQCWRAAAIAAGTAALLFRELALPYCGIALLIAACHRRWLEALGWAAGIAAFAAFYAWHIHEVHVQLAAAGAASSSSLGQWLRFGGLDYVLLTTRMNSLFFHAPGWLLWLYLLAVLIGLSRQPSETNQLACLTALSYLLAFAILGRPENFYWGLFPAPFLAWGAAQAPALVGRALPTTDLSSASSRLSLSREQTCSP